MLPPQAMWLALRGNSALRVASLAFLVAVPWDCRQFPPVLGEGWAH